MNQLSAQQRLPLGQLNQNVNPIPQGKMENSVVVRGKLTPREFAPWRLLPPQERFWKRVDKKGAGECWPWLGHVNENGYGTLNVEKKPRFAHRYAWELQNGVIPNDLCVCHKCDNRICCNPAHYFLGTKSDNTMDRVSKGRTARGEKQGASKLTDEQVIEMRNLYQPHSMGQNNLHGLSIKYGVSISVIHKVVAGKSWTHL